MWTMWRFITVKLFLHLKVFDTLKAVLAEVGWGGLRRHHERTRDCANPLLSALRWKAGYLMNICLTHTGTSGGYVSLKWTIEQSSCSAPIEIVDWCKPVIKGHTKRKPERQTSGERERECERLMHIWGDSELGFQNVAMGQWMTFTLR